MTATRLIAANAIARQQTRRALELRVAQLEEQLAEARRHRITVSADELAARTFRQHASRALAALAHDAGGRLELTYEQLRRAPAAVEIFDRVDLERVVVQAHP